MVRRGRELAPGHLSGLAITWSCVLFKVEAGSLGPVLNSSVSHSFPPYCVSTVPVRHF